MAARGCGSSRTVGGIYLEVPLGPNGRPVEDFLVDPVIEVPENLDLAPRGVTLIERVVAGEKTGVWDVWDHVGEKHYPNVWDFVYEVKRMGMSRRVQPNLPFEKLTPDSRVVLMHPRAFIGNAGDLYRAIDAEEQEYNNEGCWWHCPKCIHEHEQFPVYTRGSKDSMPTCIGTALHVVTGGDTVLDPSTPPRTVEREVPAGTYRARKRPDNFAPQFSRGIFMVMPAYKLVVINDPDGGQHVKALERATRSKIDVELEDD